MRKTWFVFVVLVMGLSSAVYSQEPQKDVEQNFGNLKYLHFSYFNTKNLRGLKLNMADDETGLKIKPNSAWLKKRENRWIQSFREVATILPESFFEEIGQTSWTFFISQDDWMTAYPGGINLLPSSSSPSWMLWESFPANGYSQEEMMFVALHEFGHVYDDLGSSLASWAIPPKVQTTLYGRVMGSTEDFAESFALYVLWPEYLKENFPKHYGIIKKILGREYEARYFMPNSIRSRLTVKEGGKIEN